MRVFVIGLITLAVTASAPEPRATISLTPGTTYYQMRGWEATAPGWRVTTDVFRQQVVDRGINRVRLEVKSGVENTVDYLLAWYLAECPGYPTAQCDPDPVPGSSPEGDALLANRYATINDNADPDVIDPAGFHFTDVDDAIRRTINPMRALLAARGERLWVNLCYVGFTNIIPPKNAVHQDPDEYAEFIYATFKHIDDAEDWVPDSVEIILEPDNSPNFWGTPGSVPTLMGDIIKATGDRLDAEGYHPDFVMPSPTAYPSFEGYWDGVLSVTGAMAYVKEGSYHAYNTTGGLSPISSRVQAAGLCSSMLEWWNSSNTYEKLYEYLTDGYGCAYQRGVLQPLSDEDYYAYLQQYFVPVRMGATRIAASSGNGNLAPLAFINTNGAYAVVIKAATSASFTVSDLPAGTYAIHYTTASETNTILTPQTITAGQDISTTMPAAGVMAIYADPLTANKRLTIIIRGGPQ